MQFFIHSSFRSYSGVQVKPEGLQWDLDADSKAYFLPVGDVTNEEEKRRGIVNAYNRWAYAKELDFKTIHDIQNIQAHGKHLAVEWKKDSTTSWRITRDSDVQDMLKKDPAANEGPSADVWVNGVDVGTLNGSMSLFPILMAIKQATGPGTQLAYKRAEGCIRIEKYFRGMIRKHQLFEHIMDNLIAMEDPQVLGPKKLIGTATLPDWIMGGELTSRLHIEETAEGDLKFTRPLYNDDVATTDRRYSLVKGQDDDKIAIVRVELDRVRHLAGVQHPVANEGDQKTNSP